MLGYEGIFHGPAAAQGRMLITLYLPEIVTIMCVMIVMSLFLSAAVYIGGNKYRRISMARLTAAEQKIKDLSEIETGRLMRDVRRHNLIDQAPSASIINFAISHSAAKELETSLSRSLEHKA